jgi:hypothetical protein
MTGDPRQPSLRRPTTIAIHDDCDVARDIGTARRRGRMSDFSDTVVRFVHGSPP